MADASTAAQNGARAGAAPAPAQRLAIVLEPVAHPELGEIVIVDALFAVGRNEAPFASYPPALAGDLSRRHARLFLEGGGAYIADLGSKNGTTVNGADIRQKTSPLHDGDTITLGPALSYRVRVRRTAQPAQGGSLQSLTLTPESSDGGLQPIVITAFPFLIGKAEAAFAQYRALHPRQVDYLSRRHAHIFVKGDAPFVEDLGSTNGTLVNGKRLDEHARRLENGDTVAFGGLYFVYLASLQLADEPAPVAAMPSDATVTVVARAATAAAPSPSPSPSPDADRTTFVAAAESFLNIFCAPPATAAAADGNAEAATPDRQQPTEARRKRSRAGSFLAGMAGALRDDQPKKSGRMLGVAAAAVALALAGLALVLSHGDGEPSVRALLDEGKPAEAAALAGKVLQDRPQSEAVRALQTEAALKAHLPGWLAQLRARNFDGAGATLAALRATPSNPDLAMLAGELGWAGRVEKFMATRAAANAPIRLYADEDEMHALLDWWTSDTSAHQRLLARVAAIVPEFRDTYAGVLSHLRRLQGDDAVYLAAIERLKAAIAAELKAGRLDAIEPLLKESVEKYPRLAGLEPLRQDLALYREIDGAARKRQLGALAALLKSANFATPPFKAAYAALAAGNTLPPAALLERYAPVAAAWQAGRAQQALAGLQPLGAAGPWSAEAAAELARKKAVADSFAALQKSRNAPGQNERLLAFYATLDPRDDTWFIRAAEEDLKLDRGLAQKQAQDSITRAETLWRQYRDNGGIESRQRLEKAVTERFRGQARLLAGAQEAVQQGLRMAAQLHLDLPPQWNALQQEIAAEAGLQRRLLQESRGAVDPAMVKTKQALLGGQDDGNASRTEAAR
jgi:pSer/pThr/pTyr-binding forkhead associated (FHA) protein